MLSRSSNWVFLLILIFLLVSGLPVEAQAPTKKNATAKEKTGTTLFQALKKNPWSDIKGFRSAKFGMNEKSVYRAIAKDFKIAKSKVKKKVHPAEKTTTLEITVPDLFRTGGTAKVGYILGHKSKKLMMINVLWGQGATENVDGQAVVNMANTLRTHFLKKRFKEEGLVVNGKVSDIQTIVFRGKDQKNRMIVVVLNTAPVPEGGNTTESVNRISLLLSYIQKPEDMDVLDISIKEDEF